MLRAAVPAAILMLASPAFAQDPHADHTAQHQQPDPHAGHHGAEHQTTQPGHGGAGRSVLGGYPMNRDASGTAWQPDASIHGGVHLNRGDWTFMGHARSNGVYDWQDGPRGDEKTFLAGMIMGAARRDFSDGTLNLRAMLSPDAFMGASGYPLLFAAGETADGENTLVDRQHPHDLFMELSASYAHQLTGAGSVFVYAGLPGEPAFGPPAFMHRMAGMDSPEAPISHHWFDSTHITFGVVTLGWVHNNWKLEASRFRGREPDERRFDIETGELDSTSARLSWNPNQNLSLQVSWTDLTSPEALEPDEDEERWSASGLYTRRLGAQSWWSATLGYANKESSEGVALDAWLAEAALHPNARWTIFTRAERIESNELTGDHDDPPRTVSRLSLGAVRDFRLGEHAVLGFGALAQQHLAPDALDDAYGGDPAGAMAFVRLKVE